MAETSLYRDRNLHIIFGVTLLSVIGISAIIPAFPSIIRELGITGSQVGLLLTFFTLPGVILTPFLGILADRFGRKRILVPSLILFSLAGTACAFIRDFNFLLGMRVLQGIGGASLNSLNNTIIGDLYSAKQRVQAMGLNASVLTIGAASYPIIGGALTLLGWYYPFALSIIALPVGILVLTSLKNPEPKNFRGLGEYLRGIRSCLNDIRIVGLFATNLLAFVFMFGAYLSYFPLLIGEFGASSFIIGLILASASLTNAATASQLSRVNRWFSLTTIIKGTFAIYALALVLIPLMPSLWLLLLPAIIFGIGGGLNMPAIQTSVADLAPLEYRGAFMSINSTMIRLGQTIGPPLMGLVYVYQGSDATFFVAAALALVVPLVATVFRQRKQPEDIKPSAV
ncbi:MAG: MFS transporter [Dehalococcoidales bacterium]|nr:MFS transporter [Dehalococcoidales bacterium]